LNMFLFLFFAKCVYVETSWFFYFWSPEKQMAEMCLFEGPKANRPFCSCALLCLVLLSLGLLVVLPSPFVLSKTSSFKPVQKRDSGREYAKKRTGGAPTIYIFKFFIHQFLFLGLACSGVSVCCVCRPPPSLSAASTCSQRAAKQNGRNSSLPFYLLILLFFA